MGTIKVYFKFSIHPGRLLQFNKIKTITKKSLNFTLEYIYLPQNQNDSGMQLSKEMQKSQNIESHKLPT